MKKNKFQANEKVHLRELDETVTVSKCSYVPNMKRYSYTVKEYPHTFYFEEELEEIT
ncbi:hypothetical protein [Bacillus sp. FJAT-45037]|uniref:hypothetical protein n=1 Tax=Bacillus sp. FJAT-45037 TaxID=2011007 RepID=UPI0018E24F73|nr:hypothetical protein [Bacillus sp. FJAT-45037]